MPRVLLDCLDDGERHRAEIRGIQERDVSRNEKSRSNFPPELLVRLGGRRRKRACRKPELFDRSRPSLGKDAGGQERRGARECEKSRKVAPGNGRQGGPAEREGFSQCTAVRRSRSLDGSRQSRRSGWVSRSGVYGFGVRGLEFPWRSSSVRLRITELRTPNRRPQTGKPAIPDTHYATFPIQSALRIFQPAPLFQCPSLPIVTL